MGIFQGEIRFRVDHQAFADLFFREDVTAVSFLGLLQVHQVVHHALRAYPGVVYVDLGLILKQLVRYIDRG